MKKLLFVCFAAFCFSVQIFAQNIPTAVLVNIVKAEDERRFDRTLEDLLKNRDEKIRIRAALAAGRIGDERAISPLESLLETDSSIEVRAMAAFALGEIESIKAADAILKVLADEKLDASVRARAVEAAGKIAAANAKDEKSKQLGEAILDVLDAETKKPKADKATVLLGLTAILRAKPDEGDFVAAKFLTNLDARIRADAANTLSRLRAKNANEQFHVMLLSDDDAIARANAARALGAAEDKDAFNLLLEAAATDEDSRVRVSAIRSLGNLKDKKAADKLLERAENLLADYKKSKSANPSEKNEILEIAAALGRILPNSNDEKAIKFLQLFREADKFSSAETEIAFAQIAPEKYLSEFKAKNNGYADWRVASAYAQGLSVLAKSENAELKLRAAETSTAYVGAMADGVKANYQAEMTKALPDLIRVLAAFKPDNLSEIMRSMFNNSDVFVRAAAADVLGDQPASNENIEALKNASTKALLTDKAYNDAQLAILEALFKLDKKESIGTLLMALNSSDYLVRKKALELLRTEGLEKESPGLPTMLKNAEDKGKDRVLSYSLNSKLGVILNTPADYLRAVSRKNARAILTTEKGIFAIEFAPEDAPLTVDNFIKLAKSGYFNGLMIHRVVPNFVMQDGDPRGDGNGGPGWEIRDEINVLPYERGAVGMALSGKDTGGSQWFVTHSPQPHLDGGYTVFGKVSESDMKVVDNLVRGDKILTVKIIEGNAVQKSIKNKK